MSISRFHWERNDGSNHHRDKQSNAGASRFKQSGVDFEFSSAERYQATRGPTSSPHLLETEAIEKRRIPAHADSALGAGGPPVEGS